MDNLTHTLTGLALSNAGLNRKTRYALATLLVGSSLPDIDLAGAFWGSATSLKYHRGFTHSILGATLLGLILAAIVYALGRRATPPKKGPPLNLPWLVIVCLISTLLHAFMDFTNSYGIRPFLPFSARWYAGDIMFIIDPLLLLILAAGVAVPWLFRLISEEVGAARPGYRRGAVLALAAMVSLWGLRAFAHQRVLGMLNAHTYGDENPVDVGAFPSPANPFAWRGVVETSTAYYLLDTSALGADVSPEDAHPFYKPTDSPPLDAAEKTRTAGIFLDFARFPWGEVLPSGEGYEVRLVDLRFASQDSRRQGFVTTVKLDKSLRVLSESFNFWPPSDRDAP